ncbi:hypothetical protein BSLG_007441 [Batrachochytrium salamandrivorans]|nr:hypothetical protein BSLG_007441 [Batrachochytrium salamandrivorans]
MGNLAVSKGLPAAIACAERRELVRGQIGYEQLPLLELQDTPEAESMDQTSWTSGWNKDIVADIESTYWLTMDERQQLMSRIDIFASGPNQDRLRTVFLTELQRRIDTKKILKRAVLELCDDFAASLSLSAVKPDAVPSELQELRSNYQAERTLLGMPRPEKTTHVKLSEQDKLTIEVHRQHKVISEDLIALLCKPQNSDEKSEMVADEGELWNEPGDNELDTETLAELGYDDANIQLIATNATDDPILQAHTEMSQHVRHKITIPSSVRSFDSRFSTRIPKDFISLAAEPTSGAGEFSNELENRVINVLGRFELPLNEKLTRFKEVEELYDEIMKTVRNHLEAYEDEDQVLVCPTAPLDVQIQITDNFLGD